MDERAWTRPQKGVSVYEETPAIDDWEEGEIIELPPHEAVGTFYINLDPYLIAKHLFNTSYDEVWPILGQARVIPEETPEAFDMPASPSRRAVGRVRKYYEPDEFYFVDDEEVESISPTESES